MRLENIVKHIEDAKCQTYVGYFTTTGIVLMLQFQVDAQTTLGSYHLSLGKINPDVKIGITSEGFVYTLVITKGTKSAPIVRKLRKATTMMIETLPLEESKK